MKKQKQRLFTILLLTALIILSGLMKSEAKVYAAETTSETGETAILTDPRDISEPVSAEFISDSASGDPAEVGGEVSDSETVTETIPTETLSEAFRSEAEQMPAERLNEPGTGVSEAVTIEQPTESVNEPRPESEPEETAETDSGQTPDSPAEPDFELTTDNEEQTEAQTVPETGDTAETAPAVQRSSSNLRSGTAQTINAYILRGTNIRRSPNGTIITKLTQPIYITASIEGAWLKFTYKGETAFVYKDLVSVNPQPITGYACGTVNIRQSPNGVKLGTISQNTVVTGTLEKNWIRFTYQGKTAYVYASLVQPNPVEIEVYIKVNSNIRKSPAGEIIGRTTLPTKVKAAPINGWLRFQYQGRDAYVHQSVIDQNIVEFSGFSNFEINVRDTAAGNIIGRLTKHTVISGRVSGDWLYFTYRQQAAKVYFPYLRDYREKVSVYILQDTNLRQSPNGYISGYMPLPAYVKANISGNWYKFTYEGKIYYAHKSRSQTYQPNIAGYLKDRINIRKSPNGSIVATGKKGQYVSGTLEKDWIRFSYNGQTAYVYAPLVVKKADMVNSDIDISNFSNLTPSEIVDLMGPIFTAEQEKSHILASVSMAQFILESGYGRSGLSQNAYNLFGVKHFLSKDHWLGERWGGYSTYTVETQEYIDGKYVTITADFRKYPNIEKSIEDHTYLLLNAKNGDHYRYRAAQYETDYRKAFQIIKDGGYATAPDYVDYLCRLVEQWDLTRFDLEMKKPFEPFKIRVIKGNWNNYRSAPSINAQVKGRLNAGIYTIIEMKNNWGKLDRNLGWVYLNNSNITRNLEEPDQTIKVRVIVDALRYRSQPSLEGEILGFVEPGEHYISEQKNGWGKLADGRGWILIENPDYVQIIG